MELVVDTNVLMTFFWKNSFTKRIFFDERFEFFSPEYSLEEINSYESEILKKAKISLNEFKRLRRELAIYIEFIPVEEYREFLKKAARLPDKKDIDFFALALKLKMPIWSNDRHLKEQSMVPVFTTEELVELYPL